MVDSVKLSQTVVVIGLENSGKTTLLRYMSKKDGEVVPTANFEIHYIQATAVPNQILVFDCSGQGRHRENWRTFYEVSEGIGFVIDSTDGERLKYVKLAIEDVFREDIILKKEIPVMFFFNKCEHQNAFEKDTLTDILGINNWKKVVKNPIASRETNGFTGKGLDDCFKWLYDNRHHNKPKE